VRNEKGISQRKLEKLSGMSYVNISRIENGQSATRPTLEKLARALGAPVAELLEHGSSRGTLLDMGGFLNSLGFEPEIYFTDIELPTEDLYELYEAVYGRLLKAEQRTAEERWQEPFDSGLGPRLEQLAKAESALPTGEAKKTLRKRVAKMARRVSDVYLREAGHLESTSAEVIELAYPAKTGEISKSA
jgi:transcriptional regulator with XRE-family HTH domain